MWNCLANCKICLREFVNNGTERSLDYRRNILQTGATHLFDELIDWSSINVNDALPFCSFCLQSIEKTSSLNENCNLILKEVEDLVDRFTMESIRSRKGIKSRGGLLSKAPVQLQPHLNEKSNCVICYTIYPIKAQTMQFIKQKVNTGKACTKYLLPGILKNECEFDWTVFPSLPFEPFCIKCSVRVNRLVQLAQNLDQAKEDMRKFVDEFSLDCSKRQNAKNDENTSDCREIESDVISVDGRSENEVILLDVQEFPRILDDEAISSYDPLELDATINHSSNGIQNDCFVDRRPRPEEITANAGFLPSPRMAKTNFTHQNVKSKGSTVTGSREEENMWNSFANCRICRKEYVNDGPELSLKDRKNIKATGTKHLVGELFKWSCINVEDSLPFCPSCIGSVTKISLLSEVSDSIKNEVYTMAAEFILDSGYNRKTLGGLQLKSRCVSCYTVCSEMKSAQGIKSAQEMVHHNKIMTACNKYLDRLLNNDVFEPFCAKCHMRVNQIVELDQNWEQADANMRKYAKEFSMACLMPPTSKNTTSDETLDILKEDSIIPEVKECSIGSIGHKDFVNIDNVASRRQSIENDYGGNETLPTVNVNSLIRPGTSKTNFTSENVEISDSPAVSDHPYENTGATTSSDDLPIVSPQILPQEAFGPISFNNEVTSSPVPSINLARLDAKLCSSSLDNFSSNWDIPSLIRSPKVNLQPLDYKCNSCSKVYKYKGRFLKHKNMCGNSFDVSNEDMEISACTEETNNGDVQSKSGAVGKYAVRKRKSLSQPRPILDEMTDEDDDDSDYDDHHHHVNRKRKGQIRKKLRNSSRPFKSNCKFCPAKATSGHEIFLHNQTHYDEAVDTRCEICKLVYSSKNKLDSHMTERHN